MKDIITYSNYEKLITMMVNIIHASGDTFSGIHGLVRGGLPIAVHISHHLNIPMVSNLIKYSNDHPDGLLLVVDDIIDSGQTFDRFLEISKMNNIKFKSAVMFDKLISDYRPDFMVATTTEWIVFPWETVEELPSEYHQELYSDIFSQ